MSKLLRLPAQLYSVRQFKPDRIGISIDLSHGCFPPLPVLPPTMLAHLKQLPSQGGRYSPRQSGCEASMIGPCTFRGNQIHTRLIRDTCDFARTVLETLLNHSSARPAVVVATKGGTRAVRDFDLLPKIHPFVILDFLCFHRPKSGRFLGTACRPNRLASGGTSRGQTPRDPNRSIFLSGHRPSPSPRGCRARLEPNRCLLLGQAE